jgi:hypothetical protein
VADSSEHNKRFRWWSLITQNFFAKNESLLGTSVAAMVLSSVFVARYGSRRTIVVFFALGTSGVAANTFFQYYRWQILKKYERTKRWFPPEPLNEEGYKEYDHSIQVVGDIWIPYRTPILTMQVLAPVHGGETALSGMG